MAAAAYEAVPVAEDVYWVGAVDWELRNFHGYSTHRGSTYNAYLILDEKVTLVDTVKKPFFPVMMERIASVVDPGAVRYVISNHAEMDHSGSLSDFVSSARPERILASARGVEALRDHFHWSVEVEAVAEGTRLSLGRLSLSFFEASMLHWPESMFTYLPERRLLFSQDAFGMHLATRNLFWDENDPAILRWEAAAYYANILMPYSRLVTRKLEQIKGLGVELIAPDHGPVWRDEGVGRILEWYRRWSSRQVREAATVVYDTMWGSTARMADAIVDGLSGGGLEVEVCPLAGSDRSDVATACVEAAALVVGSPTLNGGVFPRIADVLSYLEGLKPPVRVGAAFGSYGWAEGATGQIGASLERMGVRVVGSPLTLRYVPGPEGLAQCVQFGRKLAGEVKKELDEGR